MIAYAIYKPIRMFKRSKLDNDWCKALIILMITESCRSLEEREVPEYHWQSG